MMSTETRRRPYAVATLAVVLAGSACVGNIGDADGVVGAPPFETVGEGEFTCSSASQDPGPYLIRRLTTAEYMATVRDTLGVDIADLVDKIPVQQPDDGFVNAAATQVTALEHVEAWAAIAKEIAARLGDVAAFASEQASCSDFGEACVDDFIDSLGTKLFRRPPDQAQKATLTPIFADVESEAGSFADAARLALLAMLQSPWFLYRVEAQLPAEDAGVRPLDDYEIASRLSYLLWGTSPDDELFDAAAAGSLRSDEGLRAQVDRMLASDKARVSSLAYLSGWLDMERLPRLPTDLKDDLQQETAGFFEEVVWERDEPMRSLLTAELTVASTELATHYGLPDPQPGLATYDLSDVPNRRGLLTQGSVLSSGDAAASITLRGLFVLNKFLCSKVPPPPPGVNNARPEVEVGKSQRYYSELRISTSPCSGCHTYMDPLAYAFTTFGPYGAMFEVDDKGNALETQGVFMTEWAAEEKPFEDADQFIDLLAAEPRVTDCFVIKVAQFALGRGVDEADGCTLHAAREAAGDEATYQGLVRAVALQPSFRTIRAE